MALIIRDVRGIPLWLLREYLEELGGVAAGDEVVAAPGWRVQLRRLEPFRLGSLAVGQVRLEMELDDQVADDFLERFAKKTLRAGA
ncbi:MAG: DUF1952 domain-containing protein [Anaerolineales bacterium]|nr:DUF1952 domain-containing protein [Anaerolineales bacterium]